jgi:hypothetical protein
MTRQRRGTRPEALVFGGAFWLVGVPAVALPFIYLLAPLARSAPSSSSSRSGLRSCSESRCSF